VVGVNRPPGALQRLPARFSELGSSPDQGSLAGSGAPVSRDPVNALQGRPRPYRRFSGLGGLSNQHSDDRLRSAGWDVPDANGRNAPSRPVAVFGLVGGSPGGPAYPRPWRSGRVSSSRGRRRLEGVQMPPLGCRWRDPSNYLVLTPIKWAFLVLILIRPLGG